MSRSPDALFYEVQHFREQRLALLLPPAALFMIVFFAYTMFQQLVRGQPVGDEPMSDTMLVIMGPFYILLGSFFLWLYLGGKLTTEVRPTGVFVRFFPIHRSSRQFHPETIESCEVLTYRPIRDFGGWGIRRGVKGRAYNVSGNQGAYLTMRDGKRLLIGSQKSQMLVEAINSLT